MTDLDGITVGCKVWSAKHRDGATGEATRGGTVVDVGIYEDTAKPYVVYLQVLTPREVKVAVYWGGAKTPKSPLVASLARMDLDEVDPETIEEPNVTRMEGAAKQAMLGAVLLPWGKDNHLALIGAAGVLLDTGKTMTVATKAAQLERQAVVNAELEERREARRAAS
jgi:hypothetical protein